MSYVYSLSAIDSRFEEPSQDVSALLRERNKVVSAVINLKGPTDLVIIQKLKVALLLYDGGAGDRVWELIRSALEELEGR